jgi:hypothetical protein
MIIHRMPQGSLAWLEVRLGLPTASEFDKIVDNDGNLRRNRSDKSQWSQQTRKYAFTLVAEAVLNRSLETLTGIEWIERGKELEPQAAKAYEFSQEVETQPVGFVTTDDGEIGASPDRLVGDNGLLEIKCPAPQTHIRYMVDGFDEGYKAQVQGQLYVSERDWADWMSYSPEMPKCVIRAVRDERYIQALADSLDAFLDMKAGLLEQVRAAGYFAEHARMLTAVDDQRAALELSQEALEDPFGLPPLKGF